MGAWLFDKINNRFFNGKELQEVPQKFHYYYSVHGYLNRILSSPFDDKPQTAELFDRTQFYDTCIEVPADTKLKARYLREYFKASGSWVKDVYVGRWSVNGKGAFLECVALCVKPDRQVYKFKIEFRGRGAVKVLAWSERFGEG